MICDGQESLGCFGNRIATRNGIVTNPALRTAASTTAFIGLQRLEAVHEMTHRFLKKDGTTTVRRMFFAA